jgi:hypothetical protein
MELVSQLKVVVSETREQFGNPRERERPPLEAYCRMCVIDL